MTMLTPNDLFINQQFAEITPYAEIKSKLNDLINKSGNLSIQIAKAIYQNQDITKLQEEKDFLDIEIDAILSLYPNIENY